MVEVESTSRICVKLSLGRAQLGLVQDVEDVKPVLRSISSTSIFFNTIHAYSFSREDRKSWNSPIPSKVSTKCFRIVNRLFKKNVHAKRTEASSAIYSALPSADGNVIASLELNSLTFLDTSLLTVQRVVKLAKDFSERIQFMKWYSDDDFSSTSSDHDEHNSIVNKPMRLLLADEKIVQIFDSADERWTATINQGFGGIKAIEFGRNCDEILVFSDFLVR